MTSTRPQSKTRIRATRMLIDKGAKRYERNLHVERLLGGHPGIWRGADSDSAATIARLKRALRSERQLGRAGHWSYDLNRHFGLLQALKAELAALARQPAAAASDKAGASTASGICETGIETS